jgi:hypothetical protein
MARSRARIARGCRTIRLLDELDPVHRVKYELSRDRGHVFVITCHPPK